MTKQKFYEKCILMTYQHSVDKNIKEEASILIKNGCDLSTMSFSELVMQRAIAGFEELFPIKQPFDKLGFKYLLQILGFVLYVGDTKFTDDLFDMLEKYPNLLNLQKNDKDGLLLDMYVNAIMIDSHFACKLGDCIVKNGEGTVWFPKFLSVANAFGRIGNTTLSELAALRRRYPLC